MLLDLKSEAKVGVENGVEVDIPLANFLLLWGWNWDGMIMESFRNFV